MVPRLSRLANLEQMTLNDSELDFSKIQISTERTKTKDQTHFEQSRVTFEAM